MLTMSSWDNIDLGLQILHWRAEEQDRFFAGQLPFLNCSRKLTMLYDSIYNYDYESASMSDGRSLRCKETAADGERSFSDVSGMEF